MADELLHEDGRTDGLDEVFVKFLNAPKNWAGWVVGIVTGYGLEGPGIECRCGRDFPHLSKPALGPTHPPVQLAPELSRGLKAAGA